MGSGARRRPTTLIVALVVAILVILVLLVVLLTQEDGEDDTATEPTTTEAPATSEPATTATTSEPTTASTTAPGPLDTSTAVFPYASTDRRFDDPVVAARAFAVDFVGFTDPVVGEFMQGDSRSGEVEIRPRADGPVTTVLVRQLGSDDSWWVLASATADITVDTPAAGATVTSPVTVAGSALAFEGAVDVEVREDGTGEAIGRGFVTGGGDVMRPFTGQVEFPDPAAEGGAVVLLTTSAEDGSVWQATVVRVRFG
jgi:hypothetical protein